MRHYLGQIHKLLRYEKCCRYCPDHGLRIHDEKVDLKDQTRRVVR